MVKTLVCGVKTITWGCSSCKTTTQQLPQQPGTVQPTEMSSAAKAFYPHEVNIFIELVNWALEALDIYQINIPAMGVNATPINKSIPQLPRTKEEKEVLEHFSGVVCIN